MCMIYTDTAVSHEHGIYKLIMQNTPKSIHEECNLFDSRTPLKLIALDMKFRHFIWNPPTSQGVGCSFWVDIFLNGL